MEEPEEMKRCEEKEILQLIEISDNLHQKQMFKYPIYSKWEITGCLEKEDEAIFYDTMFYSTEESVYCYLILKKEQEKITILDKLALRSSENFDSYPNDRENIKNCADYLGSLDLVKELKEVRSIERI